MKEERISGVREKRSISHYKNNGRHPSDSDLRGISEISSFSDIRVDEHIETARLKEMLSFVIKNGKEK